MTQNWYVAVCNSGRLNRAEGELSRTGYRTFVPKLRKWVSHARTRKAVYRPILGRYLFVEIGNYRFRDVRGCSGVESLIGVAGEPRPLPFGVVEDLIRRQLSGEWDAVANENIPIGALVRVMEGEFENLLGVLTKRRKGRLEVKLAGTSVTKSFLSMQVRPAA